MPRTESYMIDQGWPFTAHNWGTLQRLIMNDEEAQRKQKGRKKIETLSRFKETERDQHHYPAYHTTVVKVEPFLDAPHPTRYGCYLLVSGLLVMLFAVLGPADSYLPWYSFAVQTGLALLLVVAGIRLLIKSSARRSRSKKTGEKRNVPRPLA
jgi:hypothetical protein